MEPRPGKVRCTYCGGRGDGGALVEVDLREIRYDYCDAACATAHGQAVELTEVLCGGCDGPAVGDTGCVAGICTGRSGPRRAAVPGRCPCPGLAQGGLRPYLGVRGRPDRLGAERRLEHGAGALLRLERREQALVEQRRCVLRLQHRAVRGQHLLTCPPLPGPGHVAAQLRVRHGAPGHLGEAGQEPGEVACGGLELPQSEICLDGP